MKRKSCLLIVGAGSIGERHLRCALETGRTKVWVCETRDQVRHQIADRYPVAGVFPDLDQALAEPLDACVIATPAHTHIPIAQRCAQAGLHLLIEKPLTLETKEVPALQELVFRKRLVAGVAYVWRCHPLFEQFHRRLADGKWGTPLQLSIRSGQHFPTYRPEYAKTYYRSQDTGGGIVYDALSHMLNLGEWLLGPITRVSADAGHLSLPDVEVPDTVHVIARHEGVMANYAMNQHQRPNQTSLTLCCTEATVEVEVHNNRIKVMRSPDTEWEVESVEPPNRDTGFIRQINAFLDSIESQSNPLCSLPEGLQTQQAINAVLRSITGGWQNVASSPGLKTSPIPTVVKSEPPLLRPQPLVHDTA